ncbi:ACP phosphodiesterase [Paraglaciecola sp. 2405UD69-4]|uniref:acyl carrier protein phosphodiesterase n=1 Tax=Paraglaciecola sp. 2405UD69-4 TaxID=3391836 RepID=UPI0039C8FD40
MNYIAHIHLADYTATSLVGNFLGDFVRGTQLDHLPAEIEKGIRLHRSVDSFTDAHPVVIHLKQQFNGKLRRMSGVIIDIYFDYLLMTKWNDFSTTSNEQLFTQFYKELEHFSVPISPAFHRQAQRLVEYRWLNQYSNPEACFQAFSSIESRLNNKIQFAEQAWCFLQQHHNLFARKFAEFYPSLIEHGVNFVKSYQDSN